MKRTKLIAFGMATLFSVAMLLNSCSEDDPVIPTLQFVADVDGYEVTLTVETTDAATYAWDYGDGNTSTTSGSHTYTYEESGSYTIVCSVTSVDDQSVTKTQSVTIDPSPAEILSGTETSHPNGKTWVLDPKYHSATNGAGPLVPALNITMPFLVDNVLEEILGIGVEYDNEFTFKYDGSLAINNKNGVSLGSVMYSYAVAGTGPAEGFEGGMGLCGVAYTPQASGQYELKQGNLNLDVVIEDPANLGAGWEVGELALTDQMYIEPTDYFGFLEMTKIVLIQSITSTQMDVVFLMHGVVEEPTLPSTAIHVTFIPKV